MFKLPDRTYPSKVLLFGEHLVLEGAMSLAIPINHFDSNWSEDLGKEDISEFLMFLASLNYLHKERLTFLEESKYELKSNIPRGYGLGSSGNLCAALYEFLRPNLSNLNQSRIIRELAEMEGYFHGKSSGLDAYVILKNRAVLVEDKTPVIIDLDLDTLPFSIFLLDSGISRSSKSLIDHFLSVDKDDQSKSVLRKINDHIVHTMIAQDFSTFTKDLNKLSNLQWKSMQPFIVDSIKDIWEASLSREDVNIKLCGAGGGGFYLAFGKSEAIERLDAKMIRLN